MAPPAITDDVVARPRLLQHLKRQPNRAFTLICAMAGSGKTTLVRQWLDTETQPVAWLSLHADNTQLAPFAVGILAAIQGIFPRAMKTLDTTVRAQSLPSVNQLAAYLINDLSELPEPFILVIEDYHLVQDLAVHDMMARLLQHRPAQLHLVLTSRTEPPLDLHSLRGRGQMIEIRQHEIHFQREEIAEFIDKSLEQTPSSDVLDVLQNRTEGWAVALRLAILTVGQDRGLDALADNLQGTHQQALDYLANEVFSRQSAEMQQFLMRTAILDRLCAPLCSVLLDEGASARADEILRALVASNLILSPLSSSDFQWYRFHALIRTLLGARLEATLPENEIVHLHRRAARWLAENGFTEESVRHYLAAQEVECAASLVEEKLEDLLNDLDRAQFSRLLSLLPQEVIEQRCGLVLASSQEKRWQNRVGALPAQMERARALLSGASPEKRRIYQAQIDTYAAYAYWGVAQPERAIESAHAALAALPQNSTFLRGIAELILDLSLQMSGHADEALRRVEREIAQNGERFDAWTLRLSMGAWGILLMEGWLEQAAEAANYQLIRARRNNMLLGTTWGHFGSALAAFHQGRFTSALQHFSSMVEMNYVADGNAFLDSILGQAMTYEWLGNREMADRSLDQATEVAAFTGAPAAQYEVTYCRARSALVRGEVDRAFQLLPQPLATEVRPRPYYTVGNPDVTTAHVLIRHGGGESLAIAQRLIEAISSFVRQIHSGLFEVDALLLQALLHARRERYNASEEALQRALELGNKQGSLRAFVEMGGPLIPQIRQMLAHGVAPTFVQRILDCFPESGKSGPSGETGLIMPLSNRELDVLELLVRRYTNQEIAEALVVAPNTVRSHLGRLFEKLGAENRRDAVIKARTYGILP